MPTISIKAVAVFCSDKRLAKIAFIPPLYHKTKVCQIGLKPPFLAIFEVFFGFISKDEHTACQAVS